MPKSIHDRLKLAEEFRTNSKLPWLPVLLRCTENDAAPDLIVPATPDMEYAPKSLFLKAFALAEFCTDCSLSHTQSNIYPDLSLRNRFFTYRNACYRIKPNPPEVITLWRNLTKELSKARPIRRTVLEMWYHLLAPQLVAQSLPMGLTEIAIEKTLND